MKSIEKDKIFNKKVMLGFMTLLLVFLIIIVSSFWSFIIDPSRIGTNKFLTDQLIIISITISTTVSMLFIAQASNASDKKSEIAKAKVEFNLSIGEVKKAGLTRFFQWIKRVLQEKDKKEMAENGMLKLGLSYSIYELEDSEIRALTLAQKYGDTFYKALTKKEIKEVLKLKKYIHNYKFVKSGYYASTSSQGSYKTNSEHASSENKKKILTVVSQLGSKIVLSLIMSMIIASLVRDVSQDGSTAQGWITFLSRLSAFVSSCFLGYLVGCKINDMDAFYIRKRIEAHTLYLEDSAFKEVDEAKEEYIERVKRENLLSYNEHIKEEEDNGQSE